MREVRRIRPGDAGWQEAVSLKKDRAYRVVARDTGRSLSDIEALYDAGAMRNGMPFHDAMLRAEIADNPLLLLTNEGEIEGYACMRLTTLVDTEVRVAIVTDICLKDDLDEDGRTVWCRRVLEEGRASGAENVQISVDGKDGPTMGYLGGAMLKSTWHWWNG